MDEITPLPAVPVVSESPQIGADEPPAPPPMNQLPELSPEEIHKNILRCHMLGNRVRLRLIQWLFVLLEKGNPLPLGGSRPAIYIIKNLQMEKSEAYDLLRVTRNLPRMPHSSRAFETGDISWAKWKQISLAVENGGDDAQWLAFARTHRPGELKAEVRDALANKRKRPREDGRGLSNIKVALNARLTLEVHEILRKALEKASAIWQELHEKDGVEGEERKRPSLEDLIEFIARSILETDFLGKLNRKERRRAVYNIIYQVCPQCRTSCQHTHEGPVEVPHDHVEEIKKKARIIEVDQEDVVKGEALPPGQITKKGIPPGVRIKVLLRDLNRCAHCGAAISLHLHHVIFRSKGGPNEVWNLVSTCDRCHSCIHGGTLQVFMDPLGKLHWKSSADWIGRVLGDELKEFASIPPVTIVVAPREDFSIEAAHDSSDSSAMPRGAKDAVRHLVNTKKLSRLEAQKQVWKAREMLSNLGRAPTDEEIFATAVTGELVVEGRIVRGCGKSGPEGGKTPREAPGKAPEGPESPKNTGLA